MLVHSHQYFQYFGCLYIIADDFFHLLQDNMHFIEQNPDLSIEIL